MPNRLIWVLEQRETGIKRKNGKSKTVRKLLFSTAILAIAHLVSLKREDTRNKIEKSELIYDYKSQRVGWLTNF